MRQNKKSSRIWTSEQDLLLRRIMKYFYNIRKNLFSFIFRKMYPSLFNLEQDYNKVKISWSQVSFEMSKEIQKIYFLKSDKQCKERWFNHLNPFLNK